MYLVFFNFASIRPRTKSDTFVIVEFEPGPGFNLPRSIPPLAQFDFVLTVELAPCVDRCGKHCSSVAAQLPLHALRTAGTACAHEGIRRSNNRMSAFSSLKLIRMLRPLPPRILQQPYFWAHTKTKGIGNTLRNS